MLKYILRYRFDLVFSYWIFAWYLLYISGFINYNPKLVLTIAIIENLCVLGIMLFIIKSPLETILKFIGINMIIKVIPLYTVWKDKINWRNDLCMIFGLFLIYLCWSYLFGHKIYSKQMEKINKISQKNPRKKVFFYLLSPITPGMLLYDDTKKYIAGNLGSPATPPMYKTNF